MCPPFSFPNMCILADCVEHHEITMICMSSNTMQTSYKPKRPQYYTAIYFCRVKISLQQPGKYNLCLSIGFIPTMFRMLHLF